MLMGFNGAQERTRTSTSIRTLAPEASASTNSATWAGVRSAVGKEAQRACQRLYAQVLTPFAAITSLLVAGADCLCEDGARCGVSHQRRI